MPADAVLSPPVLASSVGGLLVEVGGTTLDVAGGDDGGWVAGTVCDGVGVALGVTDGVSVGVGVGVSVGDSDGVSEGSGDGEWHSTKKIFPAL